MTSGHNLLASVANSFRMSITIDRHTTACRHAHTSDELEFVKTLQCRPVSTTRATYPAEQHDELSGVPHNYRSR